MEPTWTIGDRLRKARESAGIGVQAMADALGVERKTIARWERSAAVRGQTVLAYAQMCEVPVTWFGEDLVGAGRSLDGGVRSRCLSDRGAA
jgi:transcriptional regulator with XRE-family HTH domain